MGYKFRQFEIPDHMVEALRAYAEDGTPVGDFLTAVLENDLIEALGRADDINLRALPAYGAFLYCEMPTGSYGRKGAVERWRKLVCPVAQ